MYISCLGTKVDEQRRQHIRLDDDTRRELIKASRKLIFVHGVGITGAKVEERLQPQSLTPTMVIILLIKPPSELTHFIIRVRFQKS
jgi:hypothetical protein